MPGSLWLTCSCKLSFWEIFLPADLKPLQEKAIVQFTVDKDVFAELPIDFRRGLCYASLPGTFGYQELMSVAFLHCISYLVLLCSDAHIRATLPLIAFH